MCGRAPRIILLGLLAACLLVGIGSEAVLAAPAGGCVADPPPDYADPSGGTNDTIGWVNGYWYSEPIAGVEGTRVSEAKLDAVVARTAARIETLRCVTFEEVPRVRTVDRETFAANQAEFFTTIPTTQRQFDNAKLEAALLVPTTADSVAHRQANREAAVLGYYDPGSNTIAVVTETDTKPAVAELTLAHELGHAYQDAHYNLSQYNSQVTDQAVAETGLIEGDVSLLESAYAQQCDTQWQCLTPSQSSALPVNNSGLFAITRQPYIDGPAFVRAVRDRTASSGWAPEQLYDTPPSTSRHLIAPRTYPEFEPQLPPINDRSSDAWSRLRPTDRPAYAILGPVTMSATLMAPQLEDSTVDVGIPPYAYNHTSVAGWRGDRLYVYTNPQNQTASVWRSSWATTADAAAYRQRYVSLLEHYGATQITTNRYRFSERTGYHGGVYVSQNDHHLTIVHAPSVDALDAVHAPGPSSGERSTPTAGPGIAAALLAIGSGLLLARWRRD